MEDIVEFRGLLGFYGWEREFSGPTTYVLTRGNLRIELSWDELRAMTYEDVVRMLKTGSKDSRNG